ncbi:hypothetical protein SSX86_023331 [Deinandra increscens subsp. villosa]|uniref:Aminotransferase-like plant mobile domain-containing protein n=1 Tax=Deinandra increscens subsp. villosa TaxID=3103831 RepID=A0AAP0CKK2_9ASTR
MAGAQIYPGPRNDELLFLGTRHRAYHLYYSENFTDRPLKARRCDQNFWKFLIKKITQHRFPAKLMEYLKKAGFSGVLQCYYDKIDQHLVTSLVERWRPETHTFHFPFGEATVTLEDVQMLWGLPFGDEVISGTNYRWSQPKKQQICEHLLGLTLEDPEDLTKNTLKMSTLLKKIENSWPRNDAADEECLKMARCIILHLIGGTILPDHSSSTVYFYHLQHLENLDQCGQLSWGSAALANLYKELCKATDPAAKEISGPLMLLQLWAWERIPQIAPKVKDQYNFDGPFGGRWRGSLSWSGVANHSMEHYRSLFQCLNTDQFVWMPYVNAEGRINETYKKGSACWKCDTYLIFFETFEPHLPSRVMRQFGLFQKVPTNLLINPQKHKTLHKYSGKSGLKNWKDEHSHFILHWINRMGYNVTGSPCGGDYKASREYMSWFLDRTAFFVQNPGAQTGTSTRDGNIGGRLEMLGQAIGEMHRISSQDNPYNLDDQLGGVQQVAAQYLNLAGAGHHLDYPTSHLASQWNPYEFPTQPCYNIEQPATKQSEFWHRDHYFDYREPLAKKVKIQSTFQEYYRGNQRQL